MRTVSLTSHRATARTEGQLRLVLVVAPAAKRDVLDGGQSSRRIRQDVMEFQERALRAPVSVSGDEGALVAVTLSDRALDMPRGIPRRDNGCSQLPIRPGTDRTRPRPLGRPSLVLSTFSRRSVRARSKMAPGSPFGISRRRRV